MGEILKRGRREDALSSCVRGIFSLPIVYLMAKQSKPPTKSEIVASLSEASGISKKQATQTLEALVALAYKNAKNTFTIPGLGKLVLANRKARKGRNPATGESIKIPAKRVLKFLVSKTAKDAILGVKK